MAKAIGYKKADQFAGEHSVVIGGEARTFTVAWHEPDGDSECYWCHTDDEGTYGQWFTSRGAFQDYIDRHTV